VESSSQTDLSFFVTDETCNKSTLGMLRAGDYVNCERAATLNSRLGGHLVSGHVDGRGTVEEIQRMGDGWRVSFSLPTALKRYIIEKGSICIDGVSLTAVNVKGGRFEVWVIPHTWQETTLQYRTIGSEVNIECDMIAKMIEKLMLGDSSEVKSGESIMDLIARAGFKR
jgi:riboflavin synthase